MRTGVLITARLGSTRLKRKHLLEVSGRPIVSYLVERILREFKTEVAQGEVGVVITASDEPENRAFDGLGIAGLTVFYGSVHNIPLRHSQAVAALGFSRVIAVDGRRYPVARYRACGGSRMRSWQGRVTSGPAGCPSA